MTTDRIQDNNVHPRIGDIRFQKMGHFPEGFELQYQSRLASGIDLPAAIPENVTLRPGEHYLFPTGIKIAIPPGLEGQIRPRSGLANKHGITVINTPGTIDADYRGEVKAGLINLSSKTFDIVPGMRIAQLVIAPALQANINCVDALDDTERGDGGFGSTGQ